MLKSKPNYRYFLLIAIIILLIYLSYLVLKEFLLVIITGLMLAYLFYPLFKWVNKRIKKKQLASLMTILIIILLFTLPLFFLINNLIKEANNAFMLIKEVIDKSSQNGCSNFVCLKYNEFYALAQKYQLTDSIGKTVLDIGNKISSASYNYLLNIPSLFLKFFVIIFLIYYLFIEGETLVEGVKKRLPLEEKNKEILFAKIKNITSGIFYGQMITALIQGALGIIGFYLLGIPNPILFGFIMTLVALLPVVGTFLVWGPISILMVIIGIVDDNNTLLIKGIILFGYGLLIISTVDNFIKPKIIGKKADVHPLIVLIGVLGGLTAFGLIGILLGPLIISITLIMLKMYNEGIL